MSNDKEQQPDDKKRPKEREQRKRGKRAHGTGSIFRRPERTGKLRAQDLDAFYARKMEEGLSSSRIGAIHIVISMALQQAVRYRHAARGNPGFTLARH